MAFVDEDLRGTIVKAGKEVAYLKYKNSEQMVDEFAQVMEEINITLVALKPDNILKFNELVVIQDESLELATKKATNGGRFWGEVVSGFKGDSPIGSVGHKGRTIVQMSFFEVEVLGLIVVFLANGSSLVFWFGNMESEAIFFLLYVHVDQFREIKQADDIIYKSLNIHALHGMLQVIKRITNLLVYLVYTL